MWWALLWACATEPSEGVRWQRAVRAEDLEMGKELCRTLPDDQDRAACLLDVMELHDEVRAGGCQELAAGAWADECWFRAAEQAPDDVVAARLCARSGNFRRHCAHHRLELGIEALVVEQPEVRQLSAAVAELEQAWQPHFPGSTDAWQSLVREELWRLYTTHSEDVSYEACGQALGHHRVSCPALVREGIRRRLINRSRKKNHKTASMCTDLDLLVDNAAAWATGEQAAREARDWLTLWCRAGGPPMSVDDTTPASLALRSGAEAGG